MAVVSCVCVCVTGLDWLAAGELVCRYGYIRVWQERSIDNTTTNDHQVFWRFHFFLFSRWTRQSIPAKGKAGQGQKQSWREEKSLRVGESVDE